MPRRGESWDEISKQVMLESREAYLQAKQTKFCRSCGQVRPITDYRVPRTGRRWAAYCIPCETDPDSLYRVRQRESCRKTTLKKYGLTPEQFDAMIEAQNSLCAICEDQVELVVDHCHETGDRRDLLCLKCNTGLGMFRDNMDLLNEAIIYLQRHQR